MNDGLYILKINYEKEIELKKNKYNTIIDNLNKKYKQLEEFYCFEVKEELEKIKKEYHEAMNNLKYNQKIKENENLLLINSIIKNIGEIYGDNHYHN